MPFKGDMRLGGRHSNVASLNGTASDFVSVPAYGTVLFGPTDTSRIEYDFLSTPFYMPYSTTVYADGLGGQTSVETWGLQYLPAGWVTGNSFSTNNVYVNELGGSYNAGQNTHRQIEDGTGINYQGGVVGTEWQTNGTWFGDANGIGYYWDGYGGYYAGNASAGHQWSTSSSSSFNWTSPNGSTSGTFTYSSSGCTYTADGMGSSTSNCGMWNAMGGEAIANGTESQGTGSYDENGNEVFANYSWYLAYDGNVGYTTTTYPL